MLQCRKNLRGHVEVSVDVRTKTQHDSDLSDKEPNDQSDLSALRRTIKHRQQLTHAELHAVIEAGQIYEGRTLAAHSSGEQMCTPGTSLCRRRGEDGPAGVGLQ